MDTVTDILSSFFINAPNVNVGGSARRKLPSKKVIKSPDPRHRIPTFTESSEEKNDEKDDNETIDGGHMTRSELKLQETIEPTFQPKRYGLRAIDIYKKNIVISNLDMDDSINIVGDILNSLSLMHNVKTTYTTVVTVVTSPEHKRTYKKMILDNPHMHFINFDVKHQFSKTKIQELVESQQRNIVMMDDITNLNTFQKLLHAQQGKRAANVQVIMIANDASSSLEAFKKLTGNVAGLLLHKLDKLKSLQKAFFKNVLQPLCNELGKTDFHTFFDIINQKHFGVRYLIVKNNEFRYY